MKEKTNCKVNWVKISGDRVHQHIRENEMRLWWVAERTGVHKTTLRRWLSGKIRRVKDAHAVKLAEVLETPYDAICETLPEPAL